MNCLHDLTANCMNLARVPYIINSREDMSRKTCTKSYIIGDSPKKMVKKWEASAIKSKGLGQKDLFLPLNNNGRG